MAIEKEKKFTVVRRSNVHAMRVLSTVKALRNALLMWESQWKFSSALDVSVYSRDTQS